MKEKIIEILKKYHLNHYGNFDKAIEELDKLFNNPALDLCDTEEKQLNDEVKNDITAHRSSHEGESFNHAKID